MSKFAICIFAEEDSLVTPRRIYKVLSDERAERSNYLRIIDDEGEDYLYPKNNFVFMPFPKEIEKALFQDF
jgi:hypothetical protein